ncbi:MAG: SlyX family protein [Desulfobacteraceae bacterium]
MNEDRLTEIEIKLAYQEKTIKDLNDVICDQQKEIEKLGSICENLIKIVKENGLTVPTIDASADEKPPHY